MIERLYVHNFRCLENFTLEFRDLSSALLIGKNGSGKSTLREALGVLQRICRGPNRVKEWIEGSDFTQLRTHIPMRFELDVTQFRKEIKYTVAFELAEEFKEALVAEESLVVDGTPVFARKQSQVTLPNGTTFGLDPHVAALPVIKELAFDSSVDSFRRFGARMILIAPVTARMSGFSEEETFELEADAGNLADWLGALLKRKPEVYPHIVTYLQAVIPDFRSFENVPRGERGNQLLLTFAKQGFERPLSIEFKKLSDGEKCLFLSAVIIASNDVWGPVFCFWDEPDSHLALPEIGHFITRLRKMSQQQGQFLATSHHPETIRHFSDETTFVLTRQSHLEPTIAERLSEIGYTGDLINSLLRDEIIG